MRKNIVWVLLAVVALMVVFFMANIFNAKPQSAEMVAQPATNRATQYDTAGKISEQITIIPYGEDGLYAYKGAWGPSATPAGISANNTIREYLEREKENIGVENFKVIIKPARGCNSKNMVHLLDEMAIGQISHYGMDGITKQEQAFIDSIHHE